MSIDFGIFFDTTTQHVFAEIQLFMTYKGGVRGKGEDEQYKITVN